MPTQTRYLGTALITLGSFLLFVILVIAALWYQAEYGSPEPTPDEVRAKKLQDLKGQEQQELSTYGWVEKSKGTVRVPVERAMEIYLEQNAKKK